jgi:ubiquitin-conjugating enzyme E2 D/E
VDPVGTALGVAGLAAIFSTCLEVWDFIDAGREHAISLSLHRTKLDNQRMIFLIWGRRLGFDSPDGVNYDRRLDDPFIRPTVENNLNHIKRIFSDTDKLVERYGVETYNGRASNRRRVGGRKLRPAAARSTYRSFMRNLRRNQEESSMWKVTRWSLRDEKKFDKMVNDLGELISGLERITQGFISLAESRDIAQDLMDRIDDLDTLEEIQAAASDAESVVSTAATARYLALKREKGKTNANKAPVQVQDYAASSSQARDPLAMNVSFLDSALEAEQPAPIASDDQEGMEGFNNSGVEARYSGEIVEDNPNHYKAWQSGKDGQPLRRGTKITGLTFPPEWEGAFMTWDGPPLKIPLTSVILDIPDSDDIIINWKYKWEGKVKWDFECCYGSGATAWLAFRRGDIIRHIASKSRDQPIWSGYNARGQWGYFPRVFIENVRKCTVSHFFENIPGRLRTMESHTQLAELRRFQLHFVHEMGQPFGLPEIAPPTSTPSSTDQNTSSKMEQFVSANHGTIRSTIGSTSGPRNERTYKEPHPEYVPARPYQEKRMGPKCFPKRIWNELHRELESEGEGKQVTFAPLDPGNVLELLGTIRGGGSSESPYADGIFHVRISVPIDYPFIPPRFWFVTKVYHPNINTMGTICLDFPGKSWRPGSVFRSSLISIRSMLSDPSMLENSGDISPPLVPEIAHQWKVDRGTFERTAREWTERYATGEIIWPGMREDGFSNTTGCFAIRKQIVDDAANSH